MKLFAISVLRTDPAMVADPVFLTSAIDVSEVNFMARDRAREFIVGLSRIVAKLTAPGATERAVDMGHAIFAQSFANGRLCVTVVADTDYNQRVATNLMYIVAAQFQAECAGRWERTDKDNMVAWPELPKILKMYQKPEEVDRLLKVEVSIDTARAALQTAVAKAVIGRETLAGMVARSQDLNAEAKQMYENSETLAGCGCVLQ
jgi:hypothetical protein